MFKSCSIVSSWTDDGRLFQTSKGDRSSARQIWVVFSAARTVGCLRTEVVHGDWDWLWRWHCRPGRMAPDMIWCMWYSFTVHVWSRTDRLTDRPTYSLLNAIALLGRNAVGRRARQCLCCRCNLVESFVLFQAIESMAWNFEMTFLFYTPSFPSATDSPMQKKLPHRLLL